MAEVSKEWRGPYHISAQKLIELLQKLPLDSTIYTTCDSLSVITLNPDNFWESDPIGNIDLKTEIYTPKSER